jgi:hypothetical protein
MDKYKYRIHATFDSKINVYNKKEVAGSEYGEVITAINLPGGNDKDLLAYWAILLEAGPNKNLAYFDQNEILACKDTFSWKAADVAHELQDVQGFIHNSVLVNSKNKKVLDVKELLKMNETKLRTIPMEVVVGGFVFSDRFPETAMRISQGTYAVSIETFFEEYWLRLDNGMLLTPLEAEALGLSQFMDRLMDMFDTEESMVKAHTLKVIAADNSDKNIVVYKYLKSMHQSGLGFVDLPACESCQIINSSNGLDEMKLKIAASQITSDFVLDLRKHDKYMQQYQQDNKIIIDDCRCKDMKKETADPAASPDLLPGPHPTGFDPADSTPTYTPFNVTDLEAGPGRCVQYKDLIYALNRRDDGLGEDLVEKTTWCMRNDVDCTVGGNSSDHGCVRWSEVEGVWIFDPDDNYQAISVDGDNYFDKAEIDSLIEEEKKKVKAEHLAQYNDMIDKFKSALCGCDEEESYEKAAVWSTAYINGLPNSSFAVVESGYKEGMNKNARHLPFKDSGGKVDAPHLRNALARANQIKAVLGNDTDAELRARALNKLKPYAKKNLPGSQFSDED